MAQAKLTVLGKTCAQRGMETPIGRIEVKGWWHYKMRGVEVGLGVVQASPQILSVQLSGRNEDEGVSLAPSAR